MDHVINTIRDAERVVRGWTERYPVQPTDEQVEAVARELSDSFDLDAALARAGY